MNTSRYDPLPDDPQPSVLHGEEGSIEKAIAGDYDFTIGEILSEAWQSIDGYKMPYAIVTSVYMLIYVSAVVLVILVFGKDSSTTEGINQLLSLLLAPMGAGLLMTGIHMATGRPVTVNMLFAHYDQLFPLIGLQIVMMLAIVLGLVLLVIPGIYLSMALMFAIPLMVEKKLSIVDAFETSRKAVTHHWFKIFGLMFVMGLILLVSMLPLFIGLFWTTPMMAAVMGVLYRRIFGISQNQVVEV